MDWVSLREIVRRPRRAKLPYGTIQTVIQTKVSTNLTRVSACPTLFRDRQADRQLKGRTLASPLINLLASEEENQGR
jgi:hypothetical protein